MIFSIPNIFNSIVNAPGQAVQIRDSGYRIIDAPYLEDHEEVTIIGMNSKRILTEESLKFLLRRLPDNTIILDIVVTENSCFLKLIDCNRFNTRLIVTYCQNNAIDWLYRKLPHFYNQAGVAVFDLESTLVEQEYLEIMAQELLSQKQILQMADITKQAMDGDIELIDSFHQRVQLLKGVSFDKLNTIANRSPKFPEHMQQVLDDLKTLGFKISVATGGFEPFAKLICAKLNIEEYCCNHFSMEKLDRGGILTGAIEPEIIDAQAKADWLIEQKQKYPSNDSINIAIGDGANDLEMMRTCDVAIGYKPKAIVLQSADMNIVHSDYRFLSRTMSFLAK